MRTVFVLASAPLGGRARGHRPIPQRAGTRFWRTWAPSADLCRDDKSIIVVSAKGYVTSQASCTVQWVVATAGAGGPIYSAHMRCSNLSTPEQKTELNRIIVPIDNDQLSAGVDFKDLKSYTGRRPHFSGTIEYARRYIASVAFGRSQ
jgi:hypothetical protein